MPKQNGGGLENKFCLECRKVIKTLEKLEPAPLGIHFKVTNGLRKKHLLVGFETDDITSTWMKKFHTVLYRDNVVAFTKPMRFFNSL